MAMANVGLYAFFRHRLLNVVKDRRAIGNRLRIPPGPKLEPECVHIAIRTNPGITKQIPGATNIRPCLQDRKALVRAVLLQMIGGAHARDSGTHDDDVYLLDCLRRLLPECHVTTPLLIV